MNYKDRLEDMVSSGVISQNQAKGLAESISSVSSSVEVEAREPAYKAPFILGAGICIAVALVTATFVFSGGSPEIEQIQNVAESMNTPGAVGNIGGGASKMMSFFIFSLPVLGAVLLYLPGAYNRFVSLEAEMNGAWAHVESCYQKRLDLLSNLVAVVHDYISQEKAVQGDVAKMRSSGSDDDVDVSAALEELEGAVAATEDEKENVEALVELQDKVSHSAARLLAVAESYPSLQAYGNVEKLQFQLERTEDEVNVARIYYNDTVRDYNKAIGKLPGSLVASVGGFRERSYFEAEVAAGMTVKAEITS